MNQKFKELLVIFVIVVMLLSTVLIVFVRIMPFKIYAGGWEIKTQLDSVYLEDGIRYNSKNTDKQIVRTPWGAKAANFDPDAGIDNGGYLGYPNIKMLVDDPIHVNFMEGKLTTTPLSTVHKEYSKTVTQPDGTKVTYFYDHHIYTFNAKIETDGDNYDRGDTWWDYIAEAASYSDNVLHATLRGAVIMDPWQIAGEIHTDDETGEEYRVLEAWAGIMQISCVDYTKGLSDRTLNVLPVDDALDTVITGWTIENFPVSGDPLNMYTMDLKNLGTGKVFDSADEIVQVPNGVYFDVPVTLQAGADATPNFDFEMPTVFDVFYNGRFRIDMLTSRGYVPVVGDDPPPDDPDPEKPGPKPFEWPLIEWFGNWFEAFWWIPVAIVIVIVVVLVIVLYWRIMVARATFALFSGR